MSDEKEKKGADKDLRSLEELSEKQIAPTTITPDKALRSIEQDSVITADPDLRSVETKAFRRGNLNKEK